MFKKTKSNIIILTILSATIVLFSLLAIIDYSLIIGWMLGLLIGSLNMWVSFYGTNKILDKNTSKNSAMVMSWIKFTSVLIINGGLIISIIFINKAANNIPMNMKHNISALSPINLFTYISALTFIKMLYIIIMVLRKGQHESTNNTI